MSQISEGCSRPFYLRCEDVGLNCKYVIFGKSEEKVLDITVMQKFEYHAINPGKITSEMKSKIRENTHLYLESSARKNTLPDL